MYKMCKYVFAVLAICVFASGCASHYGPTPEQVTEQHEQLKALTRSRTVTVVDESYLGAQSVTRTHTAPVLGTKVTLKRKGSLAELAAAVSEMVPLTIQIATTDPDNAVKAATGSDPLLGLPDPVPSGNRLAVSYEGTLSGLLDQLSAMSGYGWDYNAQTNTVTFVHLQVRTFTILSTPGKTSYDSLITNKSKETSSGSIGSSGVRQTVATADTSSQTAQTNKTALDFDVWQECEHGVKALLSKKGSVTGNQGAGTLTVRDTPANLRQIAAYIDDINARLSRQVALTIYVWALEVTDEADAGIDLQAVFQSGDVLATAAGVGNLATTGSVSATILNGKLKDTTAILKALRQWGDTTVVTSGGGIAMSNQPFPIQAIKRHAYLAGVSSTVNDYGQTAEVTPGEVTTGFAMTVIPHILDKRRVILQYNINLSSLDDLVEFSTQDVTVQLPQVSTRSFSQRMSLKMGQTLVLAGFEQKTHGLSTSLGLLGASRGSQSGKTLLVITIAVESAGEV